MDRERNRVEPPGPDVETASDTYAARFGGPVGQWFLEVQAGIVRDMLDGLPRGTSCLDVGGGHAQLTPTLCDLGFETTVLGSHADAGRRLSPYVENGAVRFEVGSLDGLPYEDDSFDVAISFRLLPHTVDWRGLIGELCRVARHHVIVDYPSRRSINRFAAPLFGLKKGIEKSTRHWQDFRPAEVEATFRSHGFAITAARPQFFIPMVLHRLFRSRGLSRALEAAPKAVGLTGRYGSPVILQAMRTD